MLWLLCKAGKLYHAEWLVSVSSQWPVKLVARSAQLDSPEKIGVRAVSSLLSSSLKRSWYSYHWKKQRPLQVTRAVWPSRWVQNIGRIWAQEVRIIGKMMLFRSIQIYSAWWFLKFGWHSRVDTGDLSSSSVSPCKFRWLGLTVPVSSF